ncbi:MULTISPECIES: alpha/beta fold hydrolase [Shewanella]|uniref:alpha/beta fold hydrolase n=1 Tax=Shewanella TaxID=22 RepID=UPI000C60321D|nr:MULTISPECIES: alpha/beta fold hydrolase [Shewanella]NCQ43859.1 alpha/beta fold hydrolase [Shewanella frigidimarina]MBB1323687.1 alpha/beta fold hydrolase [Shewanella sp. SR43-8]NCO70233.1 alpha/beta fold hydrolase [Shewanella vesiculosa]NCP35773.1 alpha/beta fold hydrolase [Shewanella vesiculosa]NCP68354.1 alpha/beta fold hydrolase [Shewanella vesiculosa]
MHFVSSGQGEAVLLIHGLFGNLDNLKNLGSVLEQQHQVIRVDVPNHGLSEHWDQMDYPQLADAMIDVLDELHLTQAHVVGHSMGGKIAMAMALLHPERVISLVVADIAPVAYSPRHQIVFAGLTSLELNANTTRKSALSHLTSAGIDEPTSQFLLKNLQRTDSGFEWKMNLTGLIESYDRIIGWTLPLTDDNHFDKPALFIRGGESNYVTAEHRDEIMRQFPHASAKTLNGTGHWLHAQKPEIFNRIVSEFIEQNQG